MHIYPSDLKFQVVHLKLNFWMVEFGPSGSSRLERTIMEITLGRLAARICLIYRIMEAVVWTTNENVYIWALAILWPASSLGSSDVVKWWWSNDHDQMMMMMMMMMMLYDAVWCMMLYGCGCVGCRVRGTQPSNQVGIHYSVAETYITWNVSASRGGLTMLLSHWYHAVAPRIYVHIITYILYIHIYMCRCMYCIWIPHRYWATAVSAEDAASFRLIIGCFWFP